MPHYHYSSCRTIFILQCRSKLQLIALNRSPTLLIDHRCSHSTRQFFNYNHIAHHCEGSQHYAVTRGVGRLRHDGTALIFVAVASALTEERWSMVVIRFLRPVPDPFLTLLNPISQCCWETTAGMMRCDWMGLQWPSWAPKDHPGYISLRWLQSQICCLLQAAICREGIFHFPELCWHDETQTISPNSK